MSLHSEQPSGVSICTNIPCPGKPAIGLTLPGLHDLELDAELASGFWHVSHGVVQSELELQEPPVPLPLEVELEDVDRRRDEELVEVDRRREEELERLLPAEGSSQPPSLVYGQDVQWF